MNVNTYITALVQYGLSKELFEPCDKAFIINQLLGILELNSYEAAETQVLPLEKILQGLLDDAVSRGVCNDDITSRDLFDTKLMGVMTPPPREVRSKFAALHSTSPEAATDWYYRFSQDTDYIRRYRIQKDLRWKTATDYGNLDITINLSKPEKDPKAIAAAKSAPQSNYPKCLLCPENEGYAGRLNHPARQNHRIIPVELTGENWNLQYSPYVYYPEHCIVFNSEHTPMVINKATISKLLDFVAKFPHYFVGSNADLPIVGGSILSHDHFQGGRYTFAMEKAPIEQPVVFPGFEDIEAGIVKWPLSVIRISGICQERLVDLAVRILTAWRCYTDESAFIFAETGGEPHNTITPIARRREDRYELDLVLRNNITTPEYPLGVFHPHQELHHIKKENIGLIEVMGLAVLPSRLKQEMAALADALVTGRDIYQDELLAKHADWAEELKTRYTFTAQNAEEILQQEIGKVFATVLEHAGVFKCTPEGRIAFHKFIKSVS